MSVYYGHEVQKLQSEEECVYTRIQWHPTFSLLAVASRPAVAADGIVSICHDQVWILFNHRSAIGLVNRELACYRLL